MKRLIWHDFYYIAFILSLFFVWGCGTVRPDENLDPVYDGKPLSDWLILNASGNNSAKAAIHNIGSNGISTLIQILAVRESTRERLLHELKSQELNEEFSSKRSNLADLRNLAVEGFTILGPDAEPAISQLVKILRRSDESSFDAANALSRIGPRGVSALTNAMNDPSLQSMVVWSIGQNKQIDTIVATRILISALKSEDEVTRGNAARLLANKDSQLAIPALIPILDETNFYPLNGALIALKSYGSNARAVGPKLFFMYTNDVCSPDLKFAHDISIELIDALRQIDRPAAARVETFMINGGPLGVAGFGWTITTLPDGKNLITGGCFQTEIPTKVNHIFARTQLFDQYTGMRNELCPMNFGRCNHTAILLRNGKILVAGGEDANGKTLSSAELYNTESGKWEVTGSMIHPEHGCEAVLQPDGKALFFFRGWDIAKGGTNEKYNQQLYDPLKGTWSEVLNH